MRCPVCHRVTGFPAEWQGCHPVPALTIGQGRGNGLPVPVRSRLCNACHNQRGTRAPSACELVVVRPAAARSRPRCLSIWRNRLSRAKGKARPLVSP